MRRFLILILFSTLAHFSFSQGLPDSLRLLNSKIPGKISTKSDSLKAMLTSRIDSLSFKIPGDSASKKAMHKADSIRSGFISKADSLQLAYQKPINKLDSVGKSLEHQVKVLTSMNIPSHKVTAKLDSVTKLKTKQISGLNNKMDSLKQKANKSLSSLELPPEMKEPVQKLSQSINGYNIPMVNGKIPGIDVPSATLPGLQLPGMNTTSLGNTSIPGIGSTQLPTGTGLPNIPGATDLSKITGEAGQYGADLKNVTQGNIGDVKGLDKKVESEAMKNAPMGELTGKTAELDKYKSQINGRPDSAALTMVKQEAMKEATNHFAGKEAVLKEAMDKMSKLKTKYSDVKSMAELPKKLPNPLHDKPFIERIIPGVTFQILNSGSFMTDLNIGALYRITPRLSAGAGYVYRFTFDRRQHNNKVYGPRANVQFMISKGFSLRFAPELVNTFIPPGYYVNPTDAGKREWVWSAFVGIKKEFKVYKRIMGNTEMLYNLYNPENKSPYGDRLVVRFGFEFPMRKKVKKAGIN